MQNLPLPEKTESLRVRLIKGENVNSATVEEVAEVLGMSPGGEVDQARTEKPRESLLQYVKDKLIDLSATGQTRPVINTFHIHSVPSNTVTKPWPVCQVKVHSLNATQLVKARPLLLADGLWSTWGDKFCNVPTEVSAPKSEQASIANTSVPFQTFKTRISSKWKGTSSLDSIHKNRKRRGNPYCDAFNGDGTVNEPKFIDIARGRGDLAGKWKEDERADNREPGVADVMDAWRQQKQ